MDRKKLFVEMNEKFKKLETFDDLQKFLDELEQNEMYLVGKRRGFWALDFNLALNPKKVEYIYDDGISEGKSQIKNLYKVLRIRGIGE